MGAETAKAQCEPEPGVFEREPGRLGRRSRVSDEDRERGGGGHKSETSLGARVGIVYSYNNFQIPLELTSSSGPTSVRYWYVVQIPHSSTCP